jgi:ribosome biogenesis protein ERB1
VRQEDSESDDHPQQKDLSSLLIQENESSEMEENDGYNETDHTEQGSDDNDFYHDLFFDSEDSENERTLNTVGNVPAEWYEEYDHVGYDLEGNKIRKIKGEDNIDAFLNRDDNPWSVIDPETGQRVSIEKDLKMLMNIQNGIADGRYAQEKWFVEFNDNVDNVHAISNRPEPKSRFIPSKYEAKIIRRYAHAYKMGWIKDSDYEKKVREPNFFMLWKDDDEKRRKGNHIQAPKPKLPSHAESYNPPMEYLYDDEDIQAWEALDPPDRPETFIPRKNNNLRTTPGYDKIQEERFQRCLDLYLATRTQQKKVWLDPRSLIPKLPKPSELKPYPSYESMQYLGHQGMVRSIDVDPTGKFLASGSDDKTVRVWEVSTGREMCCFNIGKKIASVSWNPNPIYSLLAITTTKQIIFIVPLAVATKLQIQNVDILFPNDFVANLNEKVSKVIAWEKPEKSLWDQGHRLKISYLVPNVGLRMTAWHKKGDYISSVWPKGNTKAVLIHQLTKKQSQNPFTKSKGIIRYVQFHPFRPLFFIATQTQIRIYDLAEQKLEKKLVTGAKEISSFDVHPGGDNLIMSSYDLRVSWFDLDMSSKPYKILKYHKESIRRSVFHKRFPLFSSCSDDGTVHVFHGMVYDDFLKNAFIVPLKILKGHEIVNDLGVLDIIFHPTQPWIFSAGADSTIRLFI